MEIDTGRAFRKDRTVTVSLTVLCQNFQALTMGGIALFLPLIRQDLGLFSTQGGSLAAATTFLYALMQIPAGYLSDRFGAKRIYWIGVLGTTIFAFTFGLVTNYWQAVTNQLLSGLIPVTGFCRRHVVADRLVLTTTTRYGDGIVVGWWILSTDLR